MKKAKLRLQGRLQMVLSKYFRERFPERNYSVAIKVGEIARLIWCEWGMERLNETYSNLDAMIKFVEEQKLAPNGIELPKISPKKSKEGRQETWRKKKIVNTEFYYSRVWRELRYFALKAANGACHLCGHTALSSGKPLHVDHIKPRSKYPELELEKTNLQVLCEDCNLGKSNKDETDWRGTGATVIDLEAMRYARENGL